VESTQSVRRRCRRLNLPGHAHELTFSCYKKQPFLLDDQVPTFFAEALKQARTKQSFDLWAYVLMPEHVHLLVKPQLETYSISAIL
jgi:REP-associated tyrosine transposase